MKKVFLVLTLVIFGIMSCGKKDSGQKKLRVGLNAVFAPFEYIENGKITGFDVDMINEIGKNLGYEIEIVDQSFDGLIPALKAGKIDIIVSGMSSTEERKKSVDFTDDYFVSKETYLRKKGNTAVTPTTLSGKKIGVQLGTIQEIEAKSINGATVVPNESTVNTILDLKAGKIDAIILEKAVAEEYMKKNPEMEIFDEKSAAIGMAMAINKGKNPELIKQINAELKKMRENGKYDELIKKYGLENSQK
ncbi:family 3 extracellular solute-binding protein [Leptotrichia trevisanii]|jgi:cjaC protein|uniref:Family 3 extracellular solute-binding protein n=1 Tax=Leptotrichia trevisanii TaxID=109328 RepID=A0A510KZQ3_9FUSO|nr:basic amino acid ABC transporter substrate-binding protein [Leptotrichia trevisanii]BBM44981.1 family 3 extracellular solute-binding protein [Leptotrichia trevisanii]BBM52118.1 family 3 extracellular solute-binding protein [Leptotrichia trevisanii]BBM57066.1 family 3 extracellular solute-binding protein [Leptotrichia trevisanii]